MIDIRRIKQIIHENNFVATGAIRGVGYVTGEGPVDDEKMNTYIFNNMQDIDTKDQLLKQFKKTYHDILHNNASIVQNIDLNNNEIKNYNKRKK